VGAATAREYTVEIDSQKMPVDLAEGQDATINVQ